MSPAQKTSQPTSQNPPNEAVWTLKGQGGEFSFRNIESSEAVFERMLEPTFLQRGNNVDLYQIQNGQETSSPWAFGIELAMLGDGGVKKLRQWMENSEVLSLIWNLPAAGGARFVVDMPACTLTALRMTGLRTGEVPRMHIELIPERCNVAVKTSTPAAKPITFSPPPAERSFDLSLSARKLTWGYTVVEPTVVKWQPRYWGSAVVSRADRPDLETDNSHTLRTPKVDAVMEYDFNPCAKNVPGEVQKFKNRLQQMTEVVSFECYVDGYLKQCFEPVAEFANSWVEGVEDLFWVLTYYPKVAPSKKSISNEIGEVLPLTDVIGPGQGNGHKAPSRDKNWNLPAVFFGDGGKVSLPENAGVVCSIFETKLPGGGRICFTPTQVQVDRRWIDEKGHVKLLRIRIDGVVHRDDQLLSGGAS